MAWGQFALKLSNLSRNVNFQNINPCVFSQRRPQFCIKNCFIISPQNVLYKKHILLAFKVFFKIVVHIPPP
jgi:hypothetical protein